MEHIHRSAVDVQTFCRKAVQLGLYSNVGNLQYFANRVFGRVPLEGARVLDVGGGRGLLSFFAAVKGAREVVCMEPIAEGSRVHTDQEFRGLAREFKVDNVRLERSTLQRFSDGGCFDVILLHNSINHLDEAACINLLDTGQARGAYRELFARLADLLNEGGTLIVCDCSRSSFFTALGLPNPFMRNIEWHKHHEPETWAGLLSQAGFEGARISWNSFNTLRTVGRILLGNRYGAYLTVSHFRLQMRRAAGVVLSQEYNIDR